MSDFEKIDLDPQTSEARFERSEFAQVIFHNVAETYPTDAHVECRFTLTSALNPTARDWVGLYKVGWSSPRDYTVFLWAPIPEGFVPGAGQELGNRILFQAHQLPKDDGEFYQFCYVTSAGHVRGASTPFQFKQPSADDFVEIEDEDSDMMVIKSRTRALEEDLQKACLEKEQLNQRLTLLEEENESLVTKLVELERNLHLEIANKEQAQGELLEAHERMECLQREARDMTMLQDSLRDKMNTLNQEKESILKRLEENECYLNSLQEKIKSLINEKDALMGRNKTLEQEKELFKTHFTSSEETIQGYLKEVETLKKWLAEQEEVVSTQSAQITKLTTELQQEHKGLQRQVSISKSDKAHIEDLVEKLRNAEDKLSAAEHCKKLLNEEVTAVQQAHHKMSCDLEKSKSEAHSLVLKVSKLEAARQEDKAKLTAEIDLLQTEVNQKNQERETIEQELSVLRNKISSTEEKVVVDQASLFALQKAQTHLKERFSKMKAENDDKQKQLDELIHKQKLWNHTEKDLHNEIRDLKERLSMGAEEYKVKYMECRKLTSELRKAQKTMRRSPDKKATDDKSSETETVVSEKHQMSVDKGTETCSSGDDKEADTQTEDDSAVADLTSGELQAQLEELGRELSSRRAKKQRYKALYAEEREKKAFLQRHYHEELARRDDQLKQRDEEITKLQHELTKSQKEADTKIKQLQTTVDKQKKRLSDLLTKDEAIADAGSLRVSTAGRFPTQTTSYKSPPAPTYPSQYPVALVYQTQRPQIQIPSYPTLFPNPYAPAVSPDSPSLPSDTSCSWNPMTCQYPDVIAENHEVFNFHKPGNPFNILKPTRADKGGGHVDPSAPSVDQDIPDGEFQDPIAELDPLVATCDTSQALSPPLTPLPPPMLPEVLPSAKIAKVKATINEGMTGSAVYGACGMLDDLGPTEVVVEPAGASAPCAPSAPHPPPPPESVDGEDDRFHDADGDPQKLCPVCNMTFPLDMPQHKFEEHVEEHYGKTCPMCSQHFPSECGQDEFENHVQAHFNGETPDTPCSNLPRHY